MAGQPHLARSGLATTRAAVTLTSSVHAETRAWTHAVQEHDNGAELPIKDLVFYPDDAPPDRTLKLALLHMYQTRVQTRCVVHAAVSASTSHCTVAHTEGSLRRTWACSTQRLSVRCRRDLC